MLTRATEAQLGATFLVVDTASRNQLFWRIIACRRNIIAKDAPSQNVPGHISKTRSASTSRDGVILRKRPVQFQELSQPRQHDVWIGYQIARVNERILIADALCDRPHFINPADVVFRGTLEGHSLRFPGSGIHLYDARDGSRRFTQQKYLLGAIRRQEPLINFEMIVQYFIETVPRGAIEVAMAHQLRSHLEHIPAFKVALMQFMLASDLSMTS